MDTTLLTEVFKSFGLSAIFIYFLSLLWKYIERKDNTIEKLLSINQEQNEAIHEQSILMERILEKLKNLHDVLK